MCITSMTTSAAFLANFMSSLIPVQTFGIYAAIIVQVNFLLAITFLPCVIILHRRLFNIEESEEEEDDITIEDSLDQEANSRCRCNCKCSPKVIKHRAKELFADWWPRFFIFERSWITMLVFVAWFSFSLTMALQWQSLSKEEEYLPAKHFIMKAKKIVDEHFSGRKKSTAVNVDFVFGVEGIDRSNISWWDPDTIGTPVW